MTTINIGYQPSTHQIAAMLASEKVWWEEDLAKFGIKKVAMKEFPSGPPEMHAMYAGSKILMRTLGVDKLDKVILAGAFGSYIDKQSAAVLGMFPDCKPEKVYSVGNAAGDGARMALLNVDKRKEADKFARQVEYIELTVASEFETTFVKSMWIPHMKDDFPNLIHLLTEKKGTNDRDVVQQLQKARGETL